MEIQNIKTPMPLAFRLLLALIVVSAALIWSNALSPAEPSELHGAIEKRQLADREMEAKEAEEFLMGVNLYADGKGLILPLMLTKSDFLKQGKETIEEDFGLILSKTENEVIGITEQFVDEEKVLVLGCALCHVGKAGGEVIPGLGNKTIDAFQIAGANKFSLKIANAIDRAKNPFDWRRADLIGKSMNLGNFLQTAPNDAKVRGLTAPMGVLSKALEVLGRKDPPSFAAPTKIPHVWGYGPKRKVGAFYDGFVLGDPPGPAGLPMFLGNYDRQTFETMVPAMEKVEESFSELLPPAYPFAIDVGKVAKGKLIFNQNCLSCHGSHDRDEKGFPVYSAPKFTPIDVVKTDSYRTDVIDEYRTEYSQSVTDSWLGEYVAEGNSSRGYFSPKLWGIWSRFPYLHNGSVPTVYDLLSKPNLRPTSFSLKRAGEKDRFDQNKMGLTKTTLPEGKDAVKNRNIFSTQKTKGLLNKGHDFGTDLNETNKRELIEYLKTL
jgi:hypothetical protein